MPIFRTRLIIDGKIIDMETVEYEGRLWLVPDWLEYLGTGMMKPTRMIALDQLGYQEIPNFDLVKWVVSYPVPKELFEGPGLSPKVAKYDVRILPDVAIPVPPPDN